ncbi:MAG: hypothetical protein H6713_02415 [Myxococcales bacterium]|nr:hypothetical protein [Myxococcales bacterium]
MAQGSTGQRLPWHGWLVAAVILFMYANGAWDFVKTMTADAGYLRAKGFADGAEAYFTDYPIPLMLLFAANVLGALGAAVALLLRSRFAVGLAVLSAAAMAVLDGITFTLRGRWSALGPFVGWFDVGLLAMTVGFAAYCVWCGQRGLLRAPQGS